MRTGKINFVIEEAKLRQEGNNPPIFDVDVDVRAMEKNAIYFRMEIANEKLLLKRGSYGSYSRRR